MSKPEWRFEVEGNEYPSGTGLDVGAIYLDDSYGNPLERIAENVREDHAAHIVRCVNSHDALVEALENLMATDLTGGQLVARIEAARQALAAAKGEA